MSLGLRVRAGRGQPAVAPDVRRRRALLPAARHQRRARVPRARLQELGRVPRLHVLRRQLGTARLRLPGVPRQQGVLHQRRAAVPADRSGADADRGRRRAARRLLRRPRRRGLRGRADDGLRRQVRSRSRRCSATRSIRRRQAWRLRFTDRRAPSTGSGCVDGRASYGVGLETFALGFPIHFDWSWRTLFNKDWEDYVFSYQGSPRTARPAASGSARRKFSVWIGYDF